MKGRTNAGGSGGGISTHHAVLHIQAPAASNVTLIKGGITVTVLDGTQGLVDEADENIANYFYSISPSNYGVWTVLVETQAPFYTVLSDQTKSLDIEITSNKIYDMVNVPDLVLVPDRNSVVPDVWRYNGSNAKNNNTWIGFNASNIALSGSGSTSKTGSAGGNYCRTSNFNITYYNRMRIEGSSYTANVGNTKSNIWFAIAHDTMNSNLFTHGHYGENGNGTWTFGDTIDISQKYGFAYINLQTWSYNTNYNASCSGSITKLIFTVD